ncbi:isocitrate lyase/PEP mutase family protein [Acinetobacter baumannii]
MNKFAELRKKLRERIESDEILFVPGVHDALSALVAEQQGFEALYIGSYSTAATYLGLADVGVLTMEEMVNQASRVADVVNVPIISDAENGWNNAANLWRTVQAFEKAGICAIHIEDHEFGKHANVPQRVASCDSMLHKIAAARDARTDPNFLIIARTDVIWTDQDIDEGIRRMNAFTDAGADLIMAGGLDTSTLKEIRHLIKGRIVVTDKPSYHMSDEKEAGANVVLYYGLSLVTAWSAMRNCFHQFHTEQSAQNIAGYRENIAEFEKFIGYQEFASRAQKYGLGD